MAIKPHRMGRLRKQCAAQDFSAVRCTVQDVCSQLTAYAVPPEAVENVELVLAEVMNNIAEHGCANSHIGNMYCIRWRRLKRYLYIQIEDSGPPLPLSLVIEAPLNCDPSFLPVGGVGWGLIHMISDQLRYKRRDNRNFLLLSFKI